MEETIEKKSSFKETLKKISIRNIHNITKENDIKFSGPLSYRHLRIIGWVCMIIAQLGTVFAFGTSFNPNMAYFGTAASVLKGFSSVTAPLFLIAAFSLVLNAKDGYKRLIILYIGLFLLVYGALVFVHQHYIYSVVYKMTGDSGYAYQTADMILSKFTSNQFYAMNIFVDLLLCTLFTFFINYTPTKYFQNKKIHLFRSFAIFPFIYEVLSVVLKMLSARGIIGLNIYVYPLLTTKPPVTFLIFVGMAFFIKFREHYYLKKGLTRRDYQKFLNTNVNSLHFSIALSIMILIGVVIDLVALIGIAMAIYNSSIVPSGQETQVALASFVLTMSYGFGGCLPLILVIPLVLLFNYRKKYSNGLIDIIIPVAGIVLVIFTLIEGGFEVLKDTIHPIETPTI